MERKSRSARTTESYRDYVERIFGDWLDTPLIQLGNAPIQVATMHDLVTFKNGPYIANGSMRTLRAIYNHARKSNRELPHDNPVDSVDWNREKRRDTGMGGFGPERLVPRTCKDWQPHSPGVSSLFLTVRVSARGTQRGQTQPS
jgi:hypothetical protein